MFKNKVSNWCCVFDRHAFVLFRFENKHVFQIEIIFYLRKKALHFLSKTYDISKRGTKHKLIIWTESRTKHRHKYYCLDKVKLLIFMGLVSVIQLIVIKNIIEGIKVTLILSP
jgi:hypothetical protein